jgi:hypothetical protein
MAQHRRSSPNKRQAARLAPQTRTLARPPAVTQRPAAVVYGKPFILLEDEAKNTFVYKGGAWVQHSASIAECRETCQVKVLPQSVGKMVRYEIRCPVDG